jgi:hypothetical protein
VLAYRRDDLIHLLGGSGYDGNGGAARREVVGRRSTDSATAAREERDLAGSACLLRRAETCGRRHIEKY